MKRVSLTIILVLLTFSLAITGYSQNQGGIPDPNAPVSPGKAKAIRQLLELTGGLKAGKQMMDQLFPLMKRSSKQVPESVWAEIEKEYATDISLGKLVDMIVPIYNNHLSEEEINELIKFYESPIGKKMASVTPQIATEAMQVGMQWGSDILKRIQQRLKEKGYSVTTD